MNRMANTPNEPPADLPVKLYEVPSMPGVRLGVEPDGKGRAYLVLRDPEHVRTLAVFRTVDDAALATGFLDCAFEEINRVIAYLAEHNNLTITPENPDDPTHEGP